MEIVVTVCSVAFNVYAAVAAIVLLPLLIVSCLWVLSGAPPGYKFGDDMTVGYRAGLALPVLLFGPILWPLCVMAGLVGSVFVWVHFVKSQCKRPPPPQESP